MTRVGYFLLFSLSSSFVFGTTTDEWIRSAATAESQLDSQKALKCYLAASAARPRDPYLLQKVAQQYSDAIIDLSSLQEKMSYAQKALDYAQQAVAVQPNSAINVLSLAVCHGTLAEYSGTHEKIAYSRLVKEEAQRALAIDPNYAWAHHVLGRWNYEVASLGAPTQWVVKLVYGGLPAASIETGISELKIAVRQDPHAVAHRLELGFAELAAGNREEARSNFEKGLSLPSREKHDEVAKARAREAMAKL